MSRTLSDIWMNDPWFSGWLESSIMIFMWTFFDAFYAGKLPNCRNRVCIVRTFLWPINAVILSLNFDAIYILFVLAEPLLILTGFSVHCR